MFGPNVNANAFFRLHYIHASSENTENLKLGLIMLIEALHESLFKLQQTCADPMATR